MVSHLVVRSNQRDSLHLLKLQDLFADVVRSLIGTPSRPTTLSFQCVKLNIAPQDLDDTCRTRRLYPSSLRPCTTGFLLVWVSCQAFDAAVLPLTSRNIPVIGTQTLGEEYVEIYPYVNRKRNFPSKLVSSACAGRLG